MYDYDLLVVGSANADLVIGVERRPAAGETVLGGDLAVHPGGKGANQAVAAARRGAGTALLARVGDDGHGRLLLDSLRAAGVDTVGVLVGGAPTGVALITVDPSGDNSIVVSPGANSRLLPADVRAATSLFHASPGGVGPAGDPAGDGRGGRTEPGAGEPFRAEPVSAAGAARRGAGGLRSADRERARGAGDPRRRRCERRARRLGPAAAGEGPAVGGGDAGRAGRAGVRRLGRDPGAIGAGGRGGHDGGRGRVHGGAGLEAGRGCRSGGGGGLRGPGRCGGRDAAGARRSRTRRRRRSRRCEEGRASSTATSPGRWPSWATGTRCWSATRACRYPTAPGWWTWRSAPACRPSPRCWRACWPSWWWRGATAAEEVRAANPAAAGLLADRFPELALVPHERLKELSAGARLIVRTGEARPYANVLLRCGVFF